MQTRFGYEVIAYDEESRAALVFKGLGDPTPYVACFGYDTESGEWSQGTYCSDLGQAFEEYDRLRGTNVILNDRWCIEDVEYAVQDVYGEDADIGSIIASMDLQRLTRGLNEFLSTEGNEMLNSWVWSHKWDTEHEKSSCSHIHR